MVFVVDRRTTKFLHTKEYHIVPGCGLVYHNHENVSLNWPKIQCSQKFYPPENIHYTVYESLFADSYLECSELRDGLAPLMYVLQYTSWIQALPSAGTHHWGGVS